MMREIDTLVHDCMQYLLIASGEIEREAGIIESPPQMREPSADEAEVVHRLRLLKDECMKVAGFTPLDWKKD